MAGEPPNPLNRRQRLLGSLKVRSCADCGYLSTAPIANHPNRESPHHEISKDSRNSWRRGDTTTYLGRAHCFRRRWDNREFRDMTDLHYQNVFKPRQCSLFFPFSEGSPAEHREAHRNRTNRRWLIAGALVGPYIATAAGFATSEIARSEEFPATLVLGLSVAFAALILTALLINLTLNRGG